METRNLASSDGPLTHFARFPDLPPEIRARIWKHASSRRSRVVQIFFDHATRDWTAGNFAGGLPMTIHVSHEARSEALRGTYYAFHAFIDFEKDTIYLNDPAIGIRISMLAFAQSKWANEVQHLAIDEFSFASWTQNSHLYPQLHPTPATILRTNLPSLKSFTLLLNEGEDILFPEDNEDEDNESEEEDSDEDIEPSTESLLDERQNDALERLPKYFSPNSRNIHFTIVNRFSFWEDCCLWLEEIKAGFHAEKTIYPSWTRPTISILVIAEGLRPQSVAAGRFDGNGPPTLHSYGDYKRPFGVLEDDSSDVEDLWIWEGDENDDTSEIASALVSFVPDP